MVEDGIGCVMSFLAGEYLCRLVRFEVDLR